MLSSGMWAWPEGGVTGLKRPGLLAGELPTVLEPDSIISRWNSLGLLKVEMYETDWVEKWAGWELLVRSGWACEAYVG